jgi:hypothetical protein
MPTTSPAQALRPRRYQYGVAGLSLIGTGSCLMWTIILIPLAIPLALVGLVMMVWSRFIAVEPFTCPICEQPNTVEVRVQVAQCPACQRTVRRANSGWAPIA